MLRNWADAAWGQGFLRCWRAFPHGTKCGPDPSGCFHGGGPVPPWVTPCWWPIACFLPPMGADQQHCNPESCRRWAAYFPGLGRGLMGLPCCCDPAVPVPPQPGPLSRWLDTFAAAFLNGCTRPRQAVVAEVSRIAASRHGSATLTTCGQWITCGLGNL